MAQFVAKDPNAKVKSSFLSNIINVMEIGKEFRKEILINNGVDLGNDTEEGNWINLQKTLNIYKDINDKIGEKTLFMIGSQSMENKSLPFTDLKEALSGLDNVYQNLHVGTSLGGWKLMSFDEIEQKAVIFSDNPYPSALERGMLMSLLRRLRPSTSTRYNVFLDLSKETRMDGGDSCTYILTW